jgi:hypothetical protein
MTENCRVDDCQQRELRAEIERLRAALKEIADDPCIDPEGNRQIAERALNQQITDDPPRAWVEAKKEVDEGWGR